MSVPRSRSLCIWALFAQVCLSHDLERSEVLQQQPLLGQENTDFDWTQVIPNKELHYTPCYEGLQCARLDVPLNWNATGKDRNNRAAIAIVKHPAKVPVTHKQYGGIIVVNPGGPGESGVDEVLNIGEYIQTVVDAPHASDTAPASNTNDKYFDILGFDPRGVKYTTPGLNCFPDAWNQQMWLLGYTDYGMVWESDSAIGLEWAKMQALGSSCSSGDKGTGTARYVNTAQVVEDMIQIIEKHGKWRAREVERLISKDTILTEEAHAVRQRSSYTPGKELLQFWGMSAGSLLGQTFAAMHPDRVGRLVIDGVLNPDDYYSGSWLHNLQDSDMIMTKLCEYCYEAGPSKCPLYTANSAKEIEIYVKDLVFEFRDNPIAIPAETLPGLGPQVVTFGDVYLRVIGALAFPFANAKSVFSQLAEIGKGNFTGIAEFKQAQLKDTASLASCINDVCFPEKYFGLLSATATIECMDSVGHRSKKFSKEDFKSYYSELSAQSFWFSAAWARHRMFCVGFEEKPVWTYDGPISGNTTNAMLIIGNTHDTVTPLRNAHYVSTLFPGSIVLQQDSEGHCSRSNPSLCTARHIRRYFQTGELPDVGTVCLPDYRPFLGSLPQAEGLENDQELSAALAALARTREWL